MAGNFEVWWDNSANRLCWSGRGELYADAMGSHFPGATRNHIVSHGTAIRMLVNRINEAYSNDPRNQYSLRQNIDAIFNGIGISTSALQNTAFGKQILAKQSNIINNANPNGNKQLLISGITMLEDFILNWSGNMFYGWPEVNAQIGDCLDLPTHAITSHILQNGETVYTSTNAMPQQNLGGCHVLYPIAGSYIYQRLACLLFQSDWKTGELQIQCGMLRILNQFYFVVISSTNANCLTKDKLTAAPQTYYFGIPFRRDYQAPVEWFLFQQSADDRFVYTAIR